ncbi:MAG: signal peptide peptidase SppA [Leptospirales bacterium]
MRHYLFFIAATIVSIIPFTSSIPVITPAQIGQTNDFLNNPNLPYESAATADDITSMYYNPAGLGSHPLQMGYFYGENLEKKVYDNVLFFNVFGFGFSSQWRETDVNIKLRRYTVGTGFDGNKIISFGTTYSWYSTNTKLLKDYSEWNIGLIFRPFKHLSIGLVERGINLPTYLNEKLKPRMDIGIAIRPLPVFTDRLTLAVDLYSFQWDFKKKLEKRYYMEFVPFNSLTVFGGSLDFTDYFFGIKYTQNITQLSLQGSASDVTGNRFGVGMLVGQERFRSSFEPIKQYLVIDLSTPLPESKRKSLPFVQENAAFFEILNSIEIAAKDIQIKGIIIRGGNFRGGWAQAEEIHHAIEKYKQVSNKPVHAFLEHCTDIEYYITTSADTISIPPAGMIELNGLAAEMFYIKGLLDKVGIKADFISIGNYKSAPDMFRNTEMDKYEKEQTIALLNSIMDELKRAIVSGRKKIDADKLDEIFNKGFFTPKKSLELGLIDNIQYYSEFKNKLSKNPESNREWEIPMQVYAKTKFYDDHWGAKPAIAILTLEGQIVGGEAGTPSLINGTLISSESTIKVLRHLRLNPRIRGVVIRINSPGGSGLASDIIWKEIRMLQKVKPVIISLGNVAASGGYYIAVGGSEIVSNHTTVTGSIGVFFGKFSLEELYKKLGVNKAIVKTHKNSAVFSEREVFSKAEREMFTEQMQEFYELFLDRVEVSRTSLTREEIAENAQGRVYTGDEAKKLGMVDKIGGLALALELAREKANLKRENMEVILFSQNTKPGLNFLAQKTSILIPEFLKAPARILGRFERLQNENIFFILPYDIEIR